MTHAQHLIRRPLRRLFLLGTALVLLMVSAPGVADAVGMPQAHLAVSSVLSPSHLTPGDETGTSLYVIRVVNDGAGPTEEGAPITVTDDLPEGVKLDPEPEGLAEVTLRLFDNGENFYPCEEVSSPSCTAEVVLQPGYTLTMYVPVNVLPSAEGVAVNSVHVSGGGVAEVEATESSPISPEPAPFDFQSLTSNLTGADGAPFTEAGGHPYQLTTSFELNSVSHDAGFREENVPSANLREGIARLPKGVVVNPRATTTRCTEAQFTASAQSECPSSSAIGVAYPTIGVFGFATNALPTPIWNLVPPPGYAASLGFNPTGLGIFVHLLGGVNSAGEYELSARSKEVPTLGNLTGLTVELWGDPTALSHDYMRGLCAFGLPETFGTPCETERLHRALLTMPSACSGPDLSTSITAVPWQESSDTVTRSVLDTDEEGNPVSVEGCNRLEFEPTISAQPTTNLADSPTGLEFDLHQPQNVSSESPAPATLKDAKVTLPAGVSVNASGANGLSACGAGEIGLATPVGQAAPIHFSEAPQTCPAAAKLGTVEVNTPLLDHKLPGAIYLARPYQNPFGSLLAIYLAIEDEQSGIVAKLAGKVEPNPVTGQLTATFDENPELPIEDVNLHFFQGDTAPLKTSLTCGTYTTTTDLTPWSTPEGADATPSDPFQTTVNASGSGPCPTSEAQAPNVPSFSAGTESPLSGAYSPFSLRLSRADGTQHITGIDTTLPEGLTGKLAGIPYCPEADIALARSREAPEKGREELASPSCPAASEVGTVTVGAGAGISPYYANGHAYLAGPYKGAPLSLVVIVPAVAGPFDLGTVVTRVALNVGEYDARIHAVSDPLPTILDGIPLDVRSIELKLDRSDFTLNPTSCEAMAIEGSVSTQAGQTAPLKNRFQVGECGRLAFKPKLQISLKGGTKRTGHPALKAVVTYPKTGEYANIARAQVSLPHSEFLDQANLNKTCTKPVLQAGACPASSIYGKVKAWTPLLAAPLEGPVYLVGGYGYKLPALVAELNGQIRVLLVGKVDTGKNKGIRNTFEAVPDAPVEKFVLEMKGGKKYGLLENSENICKKKQVAQVSFTAQNGRTMSLSPKISNSCKGSKKKSKGKKTSKKKK